MINHKAWMAAIADGVPIGKCERAGCYGDLYAPTVMNGKGETVTLPPDPMPQHPDQQQPFLYEAICRSCKTSYTWPYGKDQAASHQRARIRKETAEARKNY